MSSNVENCTAEEFIKLCFADDALWYDRKNKKEYKFWDNYKNIDIKKWKEDGLKFYDTDKYESLPDPDATSKKLYEAHKRIWNEQYEKFYIPKVSLNKDCELKINEKDICLGSDSIMSIYWHWSGKIYYLKNMQDIVNHISCDVVNTIEYKNLCDEIKQKFSAQAEQRCELREDTFKKFIWCYLQKANTIGGFVLFPRHPSSINSMRGCNSKIRDRFDLTLECIRRAYQENIFDKEEVNPLLGISSVDKEFFRMFESFEKYAEFFCLNKSWVENGKVLNLLYDDKNDNKTRRNVKTLDEWDFNQPPLPQTEEWWIFYRNIMNRLDVRNEQIKKLIQQEGD